MSLWDQALHPYTILHTILKMFGSSVSRPCITMVTTEQDQNTEHRKGLAGDPDDPDDVDLWGARPAEPWGGHVPGPYVSRGGNTQHHCYVDTKKKSISIQAFRRQSQRFQRLHCFICPVFAHDSETQRHRDTETKRQIATETERNRDRETQRHSETETMRHTSTKIQRHRYRDRETLRHRDTETKRHWDTETETQT